ADPCMRTARVPYAHPAHTPQSEGTCLCTPRATPHALRMHGSVAFLKGTLDLILLKTLSWSPHHGYGIARWIEHCTNDVLQVEEGSLYPALHKLEERGMIAAEWGISEHNGRAKFYRLTTAGNKHLAASHDSWARFSDAVFKVLRTAPAGR